jgi:hypothetical protein
LAQTNCQAHLSACNSAADHTFRKCLPAQPVDATPSDINLFTKGGVYDPKETVWTFGGAKEGRVAPLEGGRFVA